MHTSSGSHSLGFTVKVILQSKTQVFSLSKFINQIPKDLCLHSASNFSVVFQAFRAGDVDLKKNQKS